MSAENGPVANAILLQIGALGRIDGLDREKPILVIEPIRSFYWASLTFVGQRHEFDLRLDGEAGAVAVAWRLIEAALADSAIPLGRAFIAEIRALVGDCEGLPHARVAQHFRAGAPSICD